ncbi:MAG TPA: hypothetical protein VFL61_00435 [Gaiellaceae bacterium]|nr:hypothetical protein [Gaiellaceae bacterium]
MGLLVRSGLCSPTTACPLGVDNQDAGNVRGLAGRGATLQASATHDWPELATQQRALSRINAAAVRLPLVRSDWRYGSAVFDAQGRILADAGNERSHTVAGHRACPTL